MSGIKCFYVCVHVSQQPRHLSGCPTYPNKSHHIILSYNRLSQLGRKSHAQFPQPHRLPLRSCLTFGSLVVLWQRELSYEINPSQTHTSVHTKINPHEFRLNKFKNPKIHMQFSLYLLHHSWVMLFFFLYKLRAVKADWSTPGLP